MLFRSKTEYIDYFKHSLEESGQEIAALQNYLENQLKQLDILISKINPESFWELFPVLLGIDAKLVLVTELMKFKEFSQEEIIRLVENDYQTYFKELCGYDLSMEPNHSLIFNVI